MQTSFLLGEVSPKMRGRTDSDQYMQMAQEITNGIPTPQGGVQRRPGSCYQRYTFTDFELESTGLPINYADITDFPTFTTGSYKAIPFNTSDGKHWLIIVNNQSSRSWVVYDRDSELMYALPDHDEVNLASPIKSITLNDIKSGASYNPSPLGHPVDFQYVQSGDVLFLALENMHPLTIRYRLTNHFDLNPEDNFNFPVVATWSTAFYSQATHVDDANYHQVIPYLEPNQLNNFGLGSLSYPAGAYSIGNTITLTSSAGIFENAVGDNHIGTFIRFTDVAALKSGAVVITGITNATTATAKVIQGPAGNCLPTGGVNYGTAANTYWEESAWSRHRGFPSAVTAFGSRIAYGGTTSHPNRVWFSAVGDASELNEIPYAQDATFATYTTDESRAFSVDIQGADKIRWMSSGKKIFIGAKNREFLMFSDSEVFGPSTIRVEPATEYGSDYVQPVKVGTEQIFAQRSGQRLRSIVFSFQEDDYKSQDISRLAEHIVRKSADRLAQADREIPRTIQLALQTSPDTRIWSVDSNGGLSTCTFDREAGVLAWASHVLGGSAGNVVRVLSMAAMPSVDNTSDDIYLVTVRNVSGNDIVALEKIGAYFNGTDEDYVNSTVNALAEPIRFKPVFMDYCLFDYAGSPTTSWAFPELESEEVSIVADGVYVGDTTLDATTGAVTLVTAASEVLVGYNYDTTIETVDLDIPGSPQSNQDKPKAITEVWCRFSNTSNARVQRKGQDTSWQQLAFAPDGAPSDAPVPTYTGDKRAHVGNVERNCSIRVQQNKPLPFELLALVFKGMIYD